MAQNKIKALWRYPVKSLLGEELLSVDINMRGVEGDRYFAVTNSDGKFGSGKDTRRFRRIDGLFSLESYVEDGWVWIRFPDKQVFSVNDPVLPSKISEYLGQELTVNLEENISHFDDSSIHILTTASIQKLQEMVDGVDARRFRPNIVLESVISDQDLVGKKIKIGDVLLEVTHQTIRCRMTTLAQSDLKDNPQILKTLGKNFETNFGVYAKVLREGAISVGDEAIILD